MATARKLEAECAKQSATKYYACEHADLRDEWDLSDPDNPMKHGKPFTFRHIAWSKLKWLIDGMIRGLDADKLAAVQAGVTEVY